MEQCVALLKRVPTSRLDATYAKQSAAILELIRRERGLEEPTDGVLDVGGGSGHRVHRDVSRRAGSEMIRSRSAISALTDASRADFSTRRTPTNATTTRSRIPQVIL